MVNRFIWKWNNEYFDCSIWQPEKFVDGYLNIHWYLIEPIIWHEHNAQKLTQSKKNVSYQIQLYIGYLASGIRCQIQLMGPNALGHKLHRYYHLEIFNIYHWKVFNFGCFHISSFSCSTLIRWSSILQKSSKADWFSNQVIEQTNKNCLTDNFSMKFWFDHKILKMVWYWMFLILKLVFIDNSQPHSTSCFNINSNIMFTLEISMLLLLLHCSLSVRL